MPVHPSFVHDTQGGLAAKQRNALVLFDGSRFAQPVYDTTKILWASSKRKAERRGAHFLAILFCLLGRYFALGLADGFGASNDPDDSGRPHAA